MTIYANWEGDFVFPYAMLSLKRIVYPYIHTVGLAICLRCDTYIAYRFLGGMEDGMVSGLSVDWQGKTQMLDQETRSLGLESRCHPASVQGTRNKLGFAREEPRYSMPK